MADDPRVDTQVEEEKTQPSESLAEEQKDTKTEGVTAPEELPKELEGTSDKAQERFRQLSGRVKELETEIAERKRTESVFESLRPQQPATAPIPSGMSQQQYSQIQRQFVDEYGNFNATGFTNYMKQWEGTMQVQAQRSTQQVREAIDEEKAKAKYPSMDPDSDQYDRPFEEAVAKEWLYQMVQDPASASVVKAANKVKKDWSKTEKEEEARQEEGLKKEVASKEQASAEAVGRSDQRTRVSNAQYQELVQKSRLGDEDALAERLRMYEQGGKKKS